MPVQVFQRLEANIIGQLAFWKNPGRFRGANQNAAHQDEREKESFHKPKDTAKTLAVEARMARVASGLNHHLTCHAAQVHLKLNIHDRRAAVVPGHAL